MGISNKVLSVLMLIMLGVSLASLMSIYGEESSESNIPSIVERYGVGNITGVVNVSRVVDALKSVGVGYSVVDTKKMSSLEAGVVMNGYVVRYGVGWTHTMAVDEKNGYIYLVSGYGNNSYYLRITKVRMDSLYQVASYIYFFNETIFPVDSQLVNDTLYVLIWYGWDYKPVILSINASNGKPVGITNVTYDVVSIPSEYTCGYDDPRCKLVIVPREVYVYSANRNATANATNITSIIVNKMAVHNGYIYLVGSANINYTISSIASYQEYGFIAVYRTDLSFDRAILYIDRFYDLEVEAYYSDGWVYTRTDRFIYYTRLYSTDCYGDVCIAYGEQQYTIDGGYGYYSSILYIAISNATIAGVYDDVVSDYEYGIIPNRFMKLFGYGDDVFGVFAYSTTWQNLPTYSSEDYSYFYWTPYIICLVYINKSGLMNVLTPYGTFNATIVSNTTAYRLSPFVFPFYCYVFNTWIMGINAKQVGDGVAIYYSRHTDIGTGVFRTWDLKYIGVVNVYNISKPWEFTTYEAVFNEIPVDYYIYPVGIGNRIIAPSGYESIGVIVGEISMAVPIPIPIPKQVTTTTPAPTGGIGLEWLLIAMAIIALGGIAIATRR